MIRNDFVSNSSSSSFILTIDKSYPLNDFVRKVSENCIDKKYKYPDPNLQSMNEKILSYCLDQNVLACLGSVYLQTILKNIVNGKFKNDWEQKMYNMIKEIIKDDQIYKPRYSDTVWKKIDENTLQYCYEAYEQGIVLKRHDYSIHFLKEDESCNLDYVRKQNKYNAKEFVRYLKKINKLDYNFTNDIKAPTYVIDEITLFNTQMLLKYGVQIKFDKILSLSKVKKILSDNKRIICMEIGYSGNGYDSRRIYSQKGSEFFAGIPVNIISCDYL